MALTLPIFICPTEVVDSVFVEQLDREVKITQRQKNELYFVSMQALQVPRTSTFFALYNFPSASRRLAVLNFKLAAQPLVLPQKYFNIP